MMKIKACLLAPVLLALTGFVGGCGTEASPFGPPSVSPAGSVSVEQLASRLNMRVASASRYSAVLKGRANCVSIFAEPGGAVYVNGKQLPCDQPILADGSTILVPAGAARNIQSILRPTEPPRSNEITQSVKNTKPVGPLVKVAPNNAHVSGTVVIDPGHGGRDPGTQIARGIDEKDVNLRIAQAVRRSLEVAGVHVIMTRSDDSFPSLEERPEVANAAHANLFCSIHANSCAKPDIHGYTVYIARSPSAGAKALAAAVDHRLSESGFYSDGIGHADYRVLVLSKCPAILVETGYLSNPSEAAKLGSADYCNAMGASIASGIIDALAK
jgi:N-acetylmuramoyl-L-alanine amidase